jgi:DNA polymerase-3 subunit alpha
MNASFVHLRLHSEYSLIDGIVRIDELVAKCAKYGMPAVALTDQCNLFGLIKFYKAAHSAGIKPIIGCDFYVAGKSPEDTHTQVCLLVCNQAGYKNLVMLISRAYLEGQRHGVAYVKREWIRQYAEGLIALSGGRDGDVGQALMASHDHDAAELLRQWQTDFPNRYYLELQRTSREHDEECLHKVMALAEQFACPVVATNDVRFLEKEEFEAHEARVCINEGRVLDDPRRERRYSDEQFLKSAGQMAELFSDIPEALQNSVEIAKRCSLELSLGKAFLPNYPVPEGMTLEQFFEKVSVDGLHERFKTLVVIQQHPEKKPVYEDRLRFELKIINQMGFAGYFLVVMDFIRWAKDNDIPVGPGRGSGAGSLVAYALKITDLDPLQYDLLFERFLNPERVSMPDFDIDFCMEGRDRVIDYVTGRYGRDAVSQIITFGTMAAKAVVRDVARVQGKSYGLADKLSKLIPFAVDMTLDKAFEQEEALRDFLKNDNEAQEIWDMAKHLEGITRNVGKHAGGVVIAPSKLTEFAPLYCDESGHGVVTQFDKNDVEEAGLVKFDFLGLRTLTIIDWAVKMINRRQREKGEAPIDITQIALDDRKTYQLLKRGETTAVFQVESRGMKDLIKRLQPDNIEDMTALLALYRPGPLESGMVDDFVNRKHGRAAVAYPDAQYQHASLKPILDPTYGVIVYQEQVMQIAQELAGYTLGGADLLRRAMGKKKPEEMAKQREVFESGAGKKGVDPTLALKIFDLVEKFAGYGFNKSHSAAYALVSYQTAWLKAHYPAEFMAATMSSELQNTDKIVTFIEESRSIGLTIRPPDVNEGEYMFTVNERGEIIYGLGAIKGLGEGPVNSMIAARQQKPFSDLFDFCARVDGHKVNKRAFEALIRSGALDTLGPKLSQANVDQTRAVLSQALSDAIHAAEQAAQNHSSGMGDLFGDMLVGSVTDASDGRDAYRNYRQAKPFNIRERLKGEKETLGLYLTGHPIDEYESELRQFAPTRIADLRPDRQPQQIVGLVVSQVVRKTRRGDMAVLLLDDRSGRIEATLFAEVFKECRDKLIKDTLLVIEGIVAHDDFKGEASMRVNTVRTISEARRNQVRALRVRLDRLALRRGFEKELATTLQPYRGGGCPVMIDCQTPEAAGMVELGEAWKVYPEDELLLKLRDGYGQKSVSLVYSRPVGGTEQKQ